MYRKWVLGYLAAFWFGVGSSFAQAQLPEATEMDPSSECFESSQTDGAVVPRFWGEAEYLLWWIKSMGFSTPVATTTSVPSLTNNSGGLGVPGTSILGDKPAGYNPFSGARFGAGMWLDPDAQFGVQARGFFLAPQTVTKTFSSGPNGSPVVGLPFNDAANVVGGGENAIFESFPGFLTGGDSIRYSNRLWGVEANTLVNLLGTNQFQINGVVGFRYLGLQEDLSITGVSSSINPNAAVAFLGNFYFPGTVTSVDQFKTSNQFYGGQIGAQSQWWFGNLFVRANAVVGLGSTTQIVTTNGFSTLVSPVAVGPTSAPGGTYALPSNIGRQSHTAFSVVPEAEFKIGYAVTRNVRVTVGYNFLYWSDVIRPGDQINRAIDVRSFPTSPVFVPGLVGVGPTPLFKTTDFWAQGLTFGLEIMF